MLIAVLWMRNATLRIRILLSRSLRIRIRLETRHLIYMYKLFMHIFLLFPHKKKNCFLKAQFASKLYKKQRISYILCKMWHSEPQTLSGSKVFRNSTISTDPQPPLLEPWLHRLNLKLDLQSSFGLLCTAVLIGWDPATPPLPPHLGSHMRSLLVSQDRRHLFVTLCLAKTKLTKAALTVYIHPSIPA